MTNKLSSRIILAWIVLGIAMILLTLSVTFAQSISLNRMENGVVTFKYKSTDKNNSQSIDTTFNALSDEEFFATLQRISDKYDLNLSMIKDRNDAMEVQLDIAKSMRDLDEAMKDFEASLANLKSENHMEITITTDGKNTKTIKHFEDDEFNIPDSLNNEDHIILFGEKDEDVPELEKIIINRNGKQIFIYKRKKNK